MIITVQGPNYWSDALFTPKTDIFKQNILNTAYIKTLEIFPSAEEWLSIQTSGGGSTRKSKLSSLFVIASTRVKVA